MRPIVLYGVFGGLSRQDLAIHVHVPAALSSIAADGSERDERKGFRDHVLEAFIEHSI